ncbi:hypothetical protein BKA61DRAFT_457145, partial [Leptodontidium sp. MPI-SDFR-AT-0119]
SNQVDEKTGKGLREWLLSRGKETGTQRKRECRSISFHDFTPDMRTGMHANVLVAHYSGGGLHERADIRPTTYIDLTTNLPTQATQTWLWFLISRPVLTLSPTETNTNPSPVTDACTIRPPPDFPMPIPTSYVVFACPASNVTEYPDCKDDSAPPDLPAPSTSSMHPLNPSHNRTRTSPPSTAKKIYKRKDYDFSFQGVPIFEFNQASTFHTPGRERFEILSIDNLGSWYPTDASGLCDLPEWQARLSAWEEEVDTLGREERKEDDRAYRDRGLEDPHARRGVWWEMFYQAVYREERKWRRVRECMSRGKCRIVVRWVENGDSGMSDGAGGGIGLGLGIGLGVRM